MAALFCFQVIVMMWLRYTVDLAMDVQAMTIFMQHEEIAFFLLNLAGVFLGFFWTAYEFYMVARLCFLCVRIVSHDYTNDGS